MLPCPSYNLEETIIYWKHLKYQLCWLCLFISPKTNGFALFKAIGFGNIYTYIFLKNFLKQMWEIYSLWKVFVKYLLNELSWAFPIYFVLTRQILDPSTWAKLSIEAGWFSSFYSIELYIRGGQKTTLLDMRKAANLQT